MKHEIFRVRIHQKAYSGFVVKDRYEASAWLPFRELSYEDYFDPRGKLSEITKAFPIGREIDVIEIGKTLIENSSVQKGLRLVSVAAIINDPWEKEVPYWFENKEPKILRISGIASKFFHGNIQPGVTAKIKITDYYQALGENAKISFFHPQIGDRLAGIPQEVNLELRELTLSTKALFQEIRGDSNASADPIPDKNKALGIITDTECIQHSEFTLSDDISGSIHNYDPPVFERILVLDDVVEVAKSLAGVLENQNYNVLCCSSINAARESLHILEDSNGNVYLDETIVAPEELFIGAALIDINLENDIEAGEYGGINFANEIQSLYPQCKIVFISGENNDATSVQKKTEIAGDLVITDYLCKPTTAAELIHCLSTIQMKSPCKASVFFQEQIDSSPSYVSETKDLPVKVSAHEKIKVILTKLKDFIGAESAILFSMDPLSYQTKIECCAGTEIPKSNWDIYHNRLQYSPIGDVCLTSKTNKYGWYDKDVETKFGKHRYLLYCYSAKRGDCSSCNHSPYIACRKHWYKSCAAIPISGVEGSILSYAIFVFSNKKNAFGYININLIMQLAAAKISSVLYKARNQIAEENNFAFLMHGRSACSIGHDLANSLQTAIDLFSLEDKIDKIIKGESTSEENMALKTRIKKVNNVIQFSQKIARSFANLAKDEEDRMSQCLLFEILEGREGAFLASHHEIMENNIDVRQSGSYQTCVEQYKSLQKDTDFNNKNIMDDTGLSKYLVWGRKSNLIRVIQNILNNSSQQIGASGILPGVIKVDVGFKKKNQECQNEWLYLDIADTGPGIHWKDRKRLFEPKVTTRMLGSGMGLYIVQQEMKHIGGDVEFIESVLGLGSVIRLWFPTRN